MNKISRSHVIFDLQKLATETVLKQAELLAKHWTK